VPGLASAAGTLGLDEWWHLKRAQF